MKNLGKCVNLFLALFFGMVAAASCIHLSIEDIVEVANSKCPTELSNGMTINKITYADKVVEYNVSIDERSVTVDASDENVKDFRRDLIDSYKPVYKEDPLLEAIVEQNLTLKFSFTGTISGDLFSFEIYASDLK